MESYIMFGFVMASIQLHSIRFDLMCAHCDCNTLSHIYCTSIIYNESELNRHFFFVLHSHHWHATTWICCDLFFSNSENGLTLIWMKNRPPYHQETVENLNSHPPQYNSHDTILIRTQTQCTQLILRVRFDDFAVRTNHETITNGKLTMLVN